QLAGRYVNFFNPPLWLLRGYHALYWLVRAAHSRNQEYAADRYFLAQASPELAAVALIHVTVTERLPGVRLSSIVESYVKSNQSPNDLFAEQARLARHVETWEWEEACRKELARPTGLFDSHPALKERLKALGVSPRQAIKLARQQEGPVASELFH